MSQNTDVIVAGHLCLDVIPTFGEEASEQTEITPGKLINVGKAVTSTGGAVSNTGLALHRLGVSTRLIAKLGEDIFGEETLSLLSKEDEHLTESIVRKPDASTSYSIVISRPGKDRSFFHHPGANDTFSSVDINEEVFDNGKIFHFGYPPLMKNIFINNGEELRKIFKRAKAKGLTTSLDMAGISPGSEASKINWTAWLENVLPEVDFFMPSLDEMRDALHQAYTNEETDIKWVSNLASQFLDMGAAIVVFKLGSDGLYLKSTKSVQRIKQVSLFRNDTIQNWLNRELFTSCFKANVIGTTGSGDCTIAGFLAGLIYGLKVEDTLKSAVGVGAFNVESIDSLSGVPSWKKVQERINNNWTVLETGFVLPGWEWDELHSLWLGPYNSIVVEEGG